MTQRPIMRLHDLEREVMEELWRTGGATVREVLDAINARSDRTRAYTTVLTVLQRLSVKDLVVAERHGRADRYRPALSRDDYGAARAAADVEELVAEFGEAALVRLVREVDRVSSQGMDRLRELADAEDPGGA